VLFVVWVAVLLLLARVYREVVELRRVRDSYRNFVGSPQFEYAARADARTKLPNR
jgi:hypothetical protein